MKLQLKCNGEMEQNLAPKIYVYALDRLNDLQIQLFFLAFTEAKFTNNLHSFLEGGPFLLNILLITSHFSYMIIKLLFSDQLLLIILLNIVGLNHLFQRSSSENTKRN